MSYDSDLSPDPYESQGEAPNTVFPIVLSVFCLMCCCQPFGIGGVVLAIFGMSKGSSGDIEGARKFIRYAYIVSGLGIGSGVVLYFLAFVMVLISEML